MTDLMTEPALAVAPRRCRATEHDLYRRQREALADLLAFVDAHAPGSAAPLPVLPWRVASVGGWCMARLSAFGPDPSAVRADPRRVLAAYAAVLGAPVRVLEMDGKTRHTVRGRIGRPAGIALQPRTCLYLEADLWDTKVPQPGAGEPTPPVGAHVLFAAPGFGAS